MSADMDEKPVAETRPAWGSLCGFVALGHTTPSLDAAGDVAARLLVQDRMSRYCWAYDERQADVLGDCFTEDAVWDGNVMGTIEIGPFTGRAAIVRWLTEFWPYQRDQRRHMVLNFVLEELGPASARAMTYVLLRSARDGRNATETMGFYRIDYRREPDGWRIAHLFGGFDAPFWPVPLERLGAAGRRRHGIEK